MGRFDPFATPPGMSAICALPKLLRPIFEPLRRGNERSVAVAEHLIATLAQRRISRSWGKNPGLRRGATLCLNPVGSGPAPPNIGLECAFNALRVAQFFGQHQRVLHCHAAALAHVWRAGVRRVTNEDRAASMPRVDFDPFNRPKMKLLIVFYRAEIGRDRCRKFGEAP